MHPDPYGTLGDNDCHALQIVLESVTEGKTDRQTDRQTEAGALEGHEAFGSISGFMISVRIHMDSAF